MGCVVSSLFPGPASLSNAQEIDIQSNRGPCRIWAFPDLSIDASATRGTESVSCPYHDAASGDDQKRGDAALKADGSTCRSISSPDKCEGTENNMQLAGNKNVVQALMPARLECCVPVFERATYVTCVDSVPVYSCLKKGLLGGKSRKEICRLSADTLLYLDPEISKKDDYLNNRNLNGVQDMPFGMLRVKVKSGPHANVIGWVEVNSSKCGPCAVRCMNTPSVIRKSSARRSLSTAIPDSSDTEIIPMNDDAVRDASMDRLMGRETAQIDHGTILVHDGYARSEGSSYAKANDGPMRMIFCGFA